MEIENNKIIAGFMEWEIKTYSTPISDIITPYGQLTEKQLKFHSDWNWLMEVVEKIESLNYTTHTQNIVSLGHYFRIYSAGADVVELRNYETKIKSVYIGCLKFIKWYNKQKTTKP